MVERRIEVPPGRAGERLDRFLADSVPELSRSRIQQLIAEGRVSVEGKTARPSSRLRAGETILFSIPPPRPPSLAPEERPLSVLYQDPHLMVVEKPSGMVVHPSPGHSGGTLVNVLLFRADRLSGIGGEQRPGIVHRLDKDTSGILLVAKNDAAHRALSADLSAHRIDRRYHGIVWGRPPSPSGTVRTRVGRHPVHRKKMAVLREGGREAATRFRILETAHGFSRLEFRLETGRTHQVRLHCAHLGCPIVGDELYGRPRRIPAGAGRNRTIVEVDRYLLHAFHLGFRHPARGEWMEFSVPDPPEFRRFLEAVARGGEPR